jgi:hypothetical protein
LGPPGLVYLVLVARRRGRWLVRSQVRPLTAFVGLAMFVGYGAALAALTIAPPASVAAARESSVVIATGPRGLSRSNSTGGTAGLTVRF